MPTPAERKALLFLAGVIVLGASVRVVRAARDNGAADASTRQALAHQLEAVDSAKRDEGAAKGARAKRRTPRGGGSHASKRGSDSATIARRDSADVRRRTHAARDSTPPIVDLDVATEAEIERLPRIGPVLARRIVEDRTEHGPFGSLAGFERVRGVGPALSALLHARVTFSGTARPTNALVGQRLTTRRAPPAPPRPARRK